MLTRANVLGTALRTAATPPPGISGALQLVQRVQLIVFTHRIDALAISISRPIPRPPILQEAEDLLVHIAQHRERHRAPRKAPDIITRLSWAFILLGATFGMHPSSRHDSGVTAIMGSACRRRTGPRKAGVRKRRKKGETSLSIARDSHRHRRKDPLFLPVCLGFLFPQCRLL